MKNNDLSLGAITKPINVFLSRFHFVTFFVIALGGLAAATFLFYSQIDASQTIATPESIETTMPDFDAATIKRLNELKESDDANSLEFPTNQRINPFVE